MKRIGSGWVLALAAFMVTAAEVTAGTAGAAKLGPGVAQQVSLPPTRVTDQPDALLLALKENDFAALLEAMENDKDIAQIAKQWDESAAERGAAAAKAATTEDATAEPAAIDAAEDEAEMVWRKLQSAEGVEQLIAEWQPQIAESASKRAMEFNLGFGAMLTEIASDQNMGVDEVQQMTRLMYAVQDWIGRVDFADAGRLRSALNAVSRLVRQTGAKRFEDVQLLSFEDAVVHGDALLRTVKQVLAAYDVDADQILGSVRFSERDAQADRATLHIEGRVFGVDLVHDSRMRYWNNAWINADAADSMERWEADRKTDAEMALEAEQAAAPAADTGSCSGDGREAAAAVEAAEAAKVAEAAAKAAE
ncbi:MAG: hypothetical protein IPH76_05210 [Xanthomonadales bacterium]|nr:hypothetical protein [Xanthomonadales bacterium]